MTEVKLELISDINIHLFIEKGMIGGISYIAKRYSKIDDSKEKKSFIYWDANNLYGWGISQTLPYGGFDLLNEKEINEVYLDYLSKNSPIGYILEVDPKYCSLHKSSIVFIITNKVL